jgi:hypothetical protein
VAYNDEKLHQIMRYRILFVCCFFIQILNAHSQNVGGYVLDEKKDPIPGATLYLRELMQGMATGLDGGFQLNLPEGDYTCDVSSMGFERQTINLHVGKSKQILEVILKSRTFLLDEVRVFPSDEEPAYFIMRRAIARAPFHRNQVKRYTSEAYIKGGFVLEKLPKLFLDEKAKKFYDLIKGKKMMMEAVQEIEFNAPESYKRNIIAFSTTIPDDIDSGLDPEDALGLLVSSIYSENIQGMVSPLSRNAFSVFNFKFIGSYEQGNHTVSKILFVPKRRFAKLPHGELHIEEDDWSVVYFDFSYENSIFQSRTKATCNEVKDNVFLPTSYDIDIKLKFFGVKADLEYDASIKYKDIELNVAAEEKSPVVKYDTIEKVKSARQIKAEKKLNKLMEKPKLSNREALRIAQLSNEIMREEKGEDPMEVKFSEMNDDVSVDSLASKRDTVFWRQNRTIPLIEQEKMAYNNKDTLRKLIVAVSSEMNSNDDGKGSNLFNNNAMNYIISGGKIKFNENNSLSIGGLLGAFKEYNFVDGWSFGQKLSYKYTYDNKSHYFIISPSVHYLTGRKSINWNTNISATFLKKYLGEISVKFGDESQDYKGIYGASRVENMLVSFYGDNYMSFYRSRFVVLSGKIRLQPGVYVGLAAKTEKRNVLQNTVSWTRKGTANPNAPSRERGVNMPDNYSSTVGVQFTYTPSMRYTVINGVKKEYSSNSPTFNLLYKKGFSTGEKRENIFDMLEAGIEQKVVLNIFDNFYYSVEIGKFLNKDGLYFPDYKHFHTIGWGFSSWGFKDEFFLAHYYRLHTNDKWLKAALNYSSKFLFIKRLPFMQDFWFDEALHARYLWTPEVNNYLECGYSLGFGEEIRGGIFFNFDKMKYRSMEFKFSFLIGNNWFVNKL